MRVSINIMLHKFRALKNNENSLVIRLTKDRKRRYIRLGISIDPQYWDNLRNVPKINCPNKERIEADHPNPANSTQHTDTQHWSKTPNGWI